MKKSYKDVDTKMELNLVNKSSSYFKSDTYNLENILAKKEIESGKLKKFKFIDELWNDLND
ncbi:hypothetical protein [Companilactobacillus heilongjiangensis]|uniref:Uncharacterized protein n=1 Tax=Companilactobacillus heilongjiangensis TaxID=1074467 RepID=A0A0K2LDT2_9LACO|nr:hypothetical protein [Companilactobacillus heilongjiangensis]ALB29459.1 hypothetical protein JP39_08875 [Companilactobacillus heilongjiangensis]